MKTFSAIPDIDGLYWYIVPGKKPEPVEIDSARFGPQLPPVVEQ